MTHQAPEITGTERRHVDVPLHRRYGARVDVEVAESEFTLDCAPEPAP
jgi:hypothetical protein